ncbi:MAG: hypothetical protein GY696_16645, partial [Gammaproteobacteria bacterium]|nr:hypothetical protein [Gammaproteobacteria bacterium]
FPKLLPKDHPFSTLTILQCHENLSHSGISNTLSELRQEYWVIHGRTTVKSAIKRRQKCKRFNNRPYKCPKMGPLPESRVKGVYPFSHTGVDYFGPFYCRPKENKPAEKIWVCLFTCMQIRAIHLEIVSEMSAGCFLLALRRFIARRGKPLEIYSDNALSFKLTKKTLHPAQKDGVADFLS